MEKKRPISQDGEMIKLPTGRSEFDSWFDKFYEEYDLPTGDVESLKFTVATAIMHLGPLESAKPYEHFYHLVHAAAAKQVAGNVFVEIKEAAKKAQLAAQANAESQSQETTG